MAYAIFTDVAQDQFGNAVPNATITVYSIVGGAVVSNPLPTVYSASSSIGSTPVATSNPMTSDSMGRFAFGAPDGFYAITVSGSGFASYTIYRNMVASAATGAGSGTVTSVALSLPASEITVSGSPVVGAGTLVGAWASQTANKVFAAPNGAPGTPTFRTLVNADLPASGVGAATYQSWTAGTGALVVTSFTVNAQGVVTATSNNAITVPQYGNQGTWTKAQNVSQASPAFGTPLTLDLATSNTFTITATSNFTVAAPTGPVAGGTYVVRIVQDATGNRVVTWPGTFKWPGASVPALSTAANAIDLLTMYYDGTQYLCTLQKGYA
jgi:hypothetical protein